MITAPLPVESVSLLIFHSWRCSGSWNLQKWMQMGQCATIIARYRRPMADAYTAISYRWIQPGTGWECNIISLWNLCMYLGDIREDIPKCHYTVWNQMFGKVLLWAEKRVNSEKPTLTGSEEMCNDKQKISMETVIELYSIIWNDTKASVHKFVYP